MNTHFAIGNHILVALEATRRVMDKPLPTAALSWSIKTHKVFVLRIVKKLENYGLVKTVRGPAGGIQLLRNGDDITLYDVYQATKEDDHLINIHKSNERCQIGDNVVDAIESINTVLDDSMKKQLSSKTIGDLTTETLNISHGKIQEGKVYTNYKADKLNSSK